MAASTPSRDSVDIAVLLAEKEDKVRAYIRSKDLMIDSLQSQLSNLQQDFVYNLDLANDYKRQLESADVQRESLQSALSDRDDRIARLSLLAQEKTSQLRNLHSARLDAERSAKDALRRHSAEMDQLLLRSTEEKESLAADFEARILELESTIKETDQKLSMQRATLESLISRSEKTIQTQSETHERKLADVTLAHTKQLEALESELKHIKDSLAESENQRNQLHDVNRALESQIRDLKWEIADQNKAIKSQGEVHAQALQKKESELLHLQESSEKTENALIIQRTALEARQCDLEAQIQSLKNLCHDTMQERTLLSETLERERLDTLENEDRLISQIRDGKSHIEKIKDDFTRELRRQELGIRELEEKLTQKSSIISSSEQELKMLKEKIKALTGSLDSAETRLAESNLSWERKLEEARKSRLKTRDKMVQQLSVARDKLDGEVKYLRNQIHKKASADERLREEEAQNAKIQELQRQNTQMAEVIHQMRHDMEELQKGVNPLASAKEKAEIEEKHRTETERIQNQFKSILKQKQEMIDTLLYEQSNNRGMDTTSSSSFALELQNSKLVEQVRQYSHELDTLKRERTQLVDLSNAAKAELRAAKARIHRTAVSDSAVQTGKCESF
ncbi:MAG: hypothetical protein SGCHY_003660 [Lobulomycetales sp.]